MQNDKKSKKDSIEKLRKILDNIPSKDLPEEDRKYLISLRKRLDESSKDIVYKKPVPKADTEEEVDPLKPKVTIYAREKEKVVEFTEVEEVSEVEEPSDVEFLPAEEQKEIKIEEEDIFEVVKKDDEGPEFIKVKPKEAPNKEKEEFLEVNKSEEEITEWDAVEKTPEKEEVSDWEPADEDGFEIEVKEKKPEIIEEEPVKEIEETIEKNICVKCGATLLKDYKFCLQCGMVLYPEEGKEEVTDEPVEEETSEAAESTPDFIPVKPAEKIEEKEEIKEEKEPEWEPVEVEDITPEKEVEETAVKEEESFDVEPSSIEEASEVEITEDQIEDEEEIIESEAKIEAFKDMESIDDKAAVLLYDNGYTSIDYLKDVTVKDLIKIKGIKRKTAKNIKEEIDKKIVEEAQVKPIVPGETAEGEVTEDQIEDEVVEEEDHSPAPVELSAISSEWEPATDKEIEEPDPEIEKKIEAFKDLDSVAAETAILLYDNGFTSIEELKNAAIKDLTKIKGIKKNTAKRIVKEIEKKTELLGIDEEEEPKKDEVEEVDEKVIEHEPESEDEFFEEEEIEDVPPIEIEKDETFKDINSIDVDIAVLLMDNGIKSIEDLKRATIKDLTKIRGIRKKIAKQIKKEVNELYKDELQESFDRGENPYIEEDDSEWESFDEDKIPDSTLKELKGFKHGDYTLYEKEIETKSGDKRTVRFFSKGEPDGSEPIDLPDGYEIKENRKTGVPYLKKKK
ncbi:MAG: hypothetical protein KAW45_08570 [Thermoplasmatales archaeon]|nr:hypothetical protein [Thermoplasmatales archaeon]